MFEERDDFHIILEMYIGIVWCTLFVWWYIQLMDLGELFIDGSLSKYKLKQELKDIFSKTKKWIKSHIHTNRKNE